MFDSDRLCPSRSVTFCTNVRHSLWEGRRDGGLNFNAYTSTFLAVCVSQSWKFVLKAVSAIATGLKCETRTCYNRQSYKTSSVCLGCLLIYHLSLWSQLSWVNDGTLSQYERNIYSIKISFRKTVCDVQFLCPSRALRGRGRIDVWIFIHVL